jgi:hypothetical protein
MDATWIRVALGPSRIAGAAVLLAFMATAALVAWMPWPHLLRAVIVLALGAYAMAVNRNWVARSAKHAVVALVVDIDRRITLTEASGARIEGIVQADSYVGATLTTIVVRLPARRLLRAIAILPDMLPADDFRRLRVLLRLGRESVAADRAPIPRGEGQG